MTNKPMNHLAAHAEASPEKLLRVGLLRNDSAAGERKILQSRRSYVDYVTMAPISLWEQDFSPAGEYFERCREKGVSDFRRHFHEQPEDVIDLSGKIRTFAVNAASLEAFRYSEDIRFSGGLCPVTDKDSYKLILEQLVALADGRFGIEREPITLALRETGKTLLVRMVVTPGSEQDLKQVFTAVIDISSIANLQQRQGASEEKYRSLFEAASDAMLLTDAATGIIVEVNRRAEQLLEIPGQSLAGTPLKKLLPLVADDFGGDHHRDYCETFVLRQRSRVKVPIAVSTSLIRSNGTVFALSILREMRQHGEEGLRRTEEPSSEFTGAPTRLTTREKEILRLIVAGNTNKEIAERLRLSPKTVETHRSRSMRKLNIHNTAALVKHVLLSGLE